MGLFICALASVAADLVLFQHCKGSIQTILNRFWAQATTAVLRYLLPLVVREEFFIPELSYEP